MLLMAQGSAERSGYGSDDLVSGQKPEFVCLYETGNDEQWLTKGFGLFGEIYGR